jgi:hypothetical protein
VTIDLVSETREALTGRTLVWIEATPREVRIGVDGGNVACCRAEEEGGCRLSLERQRGGPHGGGIRVYEDLEGRCIDRVVESSSRCTLVLGEDALHVEAVVNEDGCRVAARSERGHATGLSALLQRTAGLLRLG